MLLRFIILFPEAALAAVVRACLIQNGHSIKEDDEIDMKQPKVDGAAEEEDPFTLVLVRPISPAYCAPLLTQGVSG